MSAIRLSVVIPVYNEEAGLPALYARLYPALDALGEPYEVIFVNDGSRDGSAALLKDQFLLRPDVTRVVLFNGNHGQHLAIMAGFERVRGERVVTLDADLMRSADLLPGELVHVLDIDNGNRFETYVIEGEPGSGEVCLNGAAARLVHLGDRVIIVSYGVFDDSELESHEPRVVHVDERNAIVRVDADPASLVEMAR